MRLWQMLHFAKTQCGWQWNSKTVKTKVLTTKIVKKNGKPEKIKEWKDADQYMCSGTVYLHLLERRGDFIVTPDQQVSPPDFVTAKPITQPKEKCYAYVKVALALGEFTTAEGKHWNDLELHRILGGIPAKDAQAELPRDGWVNVTEELLGDPLLAAPGDVIVYDGFLRKFEDYDEKKRTFKITDTNINKQYRHIEIRSYDGFLSDYWKAQPVGRNYRILGIWRKEGFCDLWPLYRIKAFLRVLAKRETGNLSIAQRAFALNTPIDGRNIYSDMSKHPWTNRYDKIPKGHSTAAGQYQILWSTWASAIRSGFGAIPCDFSVSTQVRVATHLLLHSTLDNEILSSENCRTCLSLIREGGEGQIIQAVKKLASTTWTSLPPNESTPHLNGNYTMSNLLTDFHLFMSEEVEKGRKGEFTWVD
jgi:muramidase (phage lysozyme)